jgi:hypothetical protein
VAKRCARCGELKDKEEFSWRWEEPSSRQSIYWDYQRLSRREHYGRHQEEEIARTYEITKNRREKAQRFIYEYFSHQVCKDSGEYVFSVLTFDHVRGKKKMEASQRVFQGYSIVAIIDGISRFEVVFYNCHLNKKINEDSRRPSGRQNAVNQPTAHNQARSSRNLPLPVHRPGYTHVV